MDKNEIQKQVKVLKKLCLLVTDNEDEFDKERIFMPLNYQEALSDMLDYIEEAASNFRQIIGERDILEDQINKQKKKIKELEDERKSLRVELEIISSSLIVVLKENQNEN